MNFCLIFAFFVILLLSFVVHKDFFNPFNLFIVFWSVQVIFCLSLFGKNTVWSYGGLFYLFIVLVFCLLLSLASLSKRRRVFKNNLALEKSTYCISRDRTKFSLYLLIIFGFIYSFMLIKSFGFSFKNITSFDLFLEMNNSAAIQRYTGNISTGIINKVFLIFVYAAPMCGGYAYFFFSKFRDKILCLLTMLPSIFILLIENTKAPFVACVLFFFISLLTSHILKKGFSPTVNFRIFFKTLFLACILFSLLFLSMMFRTGHFDIATFNYIKVKICIYIFGHIPAFDYWFTYNCFKLPYTFGMQTFISIFDLLGLTTRVQGVYSESYIGGALGSNVYTYLRGIISDFGLIGSILFLLSFLGLANYNYQRILLGSKKVINQLLVMISYSFLFFFFVSIFSYSSFVFAYFIYWFFLIFIRERCDMYEK